MGEGGATAVASVPPGFTERDDGDVEVARITEVVAETGFEISHGCPP